MTLKLEDRSVETGSCIGVNNGWCGPALNSLTIPPVNASGGDRRVPPDSDGSEGGSNHGDGGGS